MAAAKPLFALMLALCAAPAAAGPIEQPRPKQDDAPALSSSAAPPSGKAAAVDAPPVLPLFAGALALLGWRLGRRRRQ